MSRALATALLAELDDDALDLLAERLAPRLEGRLCSRPTDADRWLTTGEAAEYLGTTPNALHKLTSAREIPFAQDDPARVATTSAQTSTAGAAPARVGGVRRPRGASIALPRLLIVLQSDMFYGRCLPLSKRLALIRAEDARRCRRSSP